MLMTSLVAFEDWRHQEGRKGKDWPESWMMLATSVVLEAWFQEQDILISSAEVWAEKLEIVVDLGRPPCLKVNINIRY